MSAAKPITKINRMRATVSGGSIVADSPISFTNTNDLASTLGGNLPGFPSPSICATAPSGSDPDTDFSMFPGSAAPTVGYFLAMTPTALWFYKAGWTKWRHSVGMLSS